MENAQGKGMSKGCLVALIIAGSLLVVVIILMVTCYIYKDDLAKMAANTLVNGLKVELAKYEYPDVDTVQFNSLADAFVDRLEEEKPLNFQTYSEFMGTLQTVMGDKKFAADEVEVVQEAFVQYYPELKELLPKVNQEPKAGIDSASAE
jgi:hypothetical protein